MKKYFMKGTEDEVVFGDMIEVDVTKDLPTGKTKHQHLEVKFVPELLELLLEEGIIEEKGEDEEDEGLEFDLKSDWKDDFVEDMIEITERTQARIDALEALITEVKETVSKKLQHMCMSLADLISTIQEQKSCGKKSGK